jgi:heme oxygenase
MQPSRMLTRLNLETRAHHPEADYPWLELVSLQASRAQYIDQLVATYGFEAPVEAALVLTPHLADVMVLRQRARSGLIVEDLLTLGFSPAKIARLPQCRRIAPFRDAAEALGWIYVLERSTLLHDTVRSHLASRIPTVATWAYLSAYRGVATQRWHELGVALDSFAIAPASADQIVAGARAAFDCLRDWIASEPGRFAREATERESSRHAGS